MDLDEMTDAELKAAVLRAMRDALTFLETGDPSKESCCGAPLTPMGMCQYRAHHPTKGHVNIVGYPEAYRADGAFRGSA